MKNFLPFAIALAAFGSMTAVRAAETCCAKTKACCVEKKACCAEHATKSAAGKNTAHKGAKQKSTSAKPAAAKTAKLIDVKVCPMMMHAVEGNGSGTSVVGNYQVHFCCGGCKPAFDKL
ncbi:MAG TPA: hypothetical protein VF719_00205, partial [Abditibacteriaceae bacterium]